MGWGNYVISYYNYARNIVGEGGGGESEQLTMRA